MKSLTCCCFSPCSICPWKDFIVIISADPGEVEEMVFNPRSSTERLHHWWDWEGTLCHTTFSWSLSSLRGIQEWYAVWPHTSSGSIRAREGHGWGQVPWDQGCDSKNKPSGLCPRNPRPLHWKTRAHLPPHPCLAYLKPTLLCPLK